MFKAVVIACAIADPTSCITFEDYRGPWATERQCKERAMEMGRDIGEMIYGMQPKMWRCQALKKGMLS
jgi:hypothetical protein